MLKWMMGIKRIVKIRAEEIRARAGVANASEKSETEVVRMYRKTEEDIVRTWRWVDTNI